MIGTRIRGFRHLFRMAKTLNEVGFFIKHNYFSVSFCVAMYIDKDERKSPYFSNNGDYVMLFNHLTSNVRFDQLHFKGTKYEKRIGELRMKFPHIWIIPVEKRNFNEEAALFSYKMAVPADFDKNYQEFLNANKKQVQSVSKYIATEAPLSSYIYAICGGSKNFFVWAVNAHLKHQISLFLIEKILLWNDNYSQLSKFLKKGTITAYTSPKDFIELVKETTKLRRDKRANDVINMFNTAQKKALKTITLNDRDYETLSKFGKLSSKKKINFIRKMSTIEDANEILKQMSFLADVHFEWKKESLLEFVKNADNFNCEVVIDKGDIVLLKVNDYETVKRLAKTTNWCISKDKKYWNEYVENNSMATQYVLMDFSKKEDDNLSIVGFTSVHDRGITNAHDFQNKNLMQGKRTNTVSEIKSFVSKHIDCSNIFGVLDRNGIKLSDVVSYEPNQYDWNRESMFDYLEQCIDEEDYYIIFDDGNRVVLIVEDDNVRYFLGDAFIEQRGGRRDFNSQYIIFADFNKKQNDPEKLIFGIISHNFEEHESYCARLYNDRFEAVQQSFDSKLEEYGLPYDIICRTDNPVDRFYNSLSSLELATLKDLIKDKKVIESLKDRDRSGLIKDSIINVTFGYYSSDYIDLFYDNGLTLTDVMGAKSSSDIARRMCNNMYDIARGRFRDMPRVPSEKKINDFKNGLIENYDEAMYIGYFLMLMKMLDYETNYDFVYRVVSCIYDRHSICDLFDLILTRFCDIISFNDEHYDVAKLIIAYAFNWGSPRVINVINSKKIDNNLKMFINSLTKRDVKTSEMWVRNENGNFTIVGVNEEAVVHAPRRR